MKRVPSFHEALQELRQLCGAGLRDPDTAWALAMAATDHPQIATEAAELARPIIVDLLLAIEVGQILGDDINVFTKRLVQIVDWLEETTRKPL